MTDADASVGDPRTYDIFVGIDGTGPDDKAKYDMEFANSFVSQLARRWAPSSTGQGNSMWLEGPSTFNQDRSIKTSANISFEFVMVKFRSISWPVEKIIQSLWTDYDMAALPKLRVSAGIGPSLPYQPSRPLSPQNELILRTTTYPRIFLAGYSRGGAGEFICPIC
jgi:hypothetical protein